jgi:hypothetical protein
LGESLNFLVLDRHIDVLIDSIALADIGAFDLFLGLGIDLLYRMRLPVFY